MTLVIIFSLIGYWFGGFQGFLIGAAVGYLLSGVVTSRVSNTLQGVQSQFLETSFAVMGALCKADGVVTRDEIQATEQIFAQLQLSPEQKATARAAFNRGKAPEFDLDGEIDRFVQYARGGGVLLQLFLQMQLVAVAADGEVHPAERAMLVHIARRLGLSEADVARLEALLRATAGGAASAGGPPPRQRIDDAYVALGVNPDASEAEIKKAYRKLMSENHPDKLAAKGLPESMRAMAEERARKINAAYDVIKQARGFA